MTAPIETYTTEQVAARVQSNCSRPKQGGRRTGTFAGRTSGNTLTEALALAKDWSQSRSSGKSRSRSNVEHFPNLATRHSHRQP